MSDPNHIWMPFYVGDYLVKTTHLNCTEHGAYLLLIMSAWTRGGIVPNDEKFLSETVKLSRTKWRKIAPVVLSFFEPDGLMLVHPRVLAEWKKAQNISDMRKRVGALGGRPTKHQTKTKLKAIGYDE